MICSFTPPPSSSPPVSTTIASNPAIFARPSRRSRVVPAYGLTIERGALPLPTSLLKRVDLPTLAVKV